MPTQPRRTHRKDAFITTPLTLLINPLYIIRSGLFRMIAKAAPEFQGKVLDFGCGSKPYESLFVNAESYTGVDIEMSGHDHQSSKIDFFYDGKTLPFADQHFDGVVCFEVFEHLFNPDEVLTEIRRVLKPGGKLLLSTPFSWDEHEAPYDFARYTRFGIQHLLERNGFTVSDIRKTSTYWLALCQMFIAYLVQHVFPKGNWGKLLQLTIIFPLSTLALLLNKILPKRYEYYCNNVALCHKDLT
jgi:SAM-dependent methyltransferase